MFSILIGGRQMDLEDFRDYLRYERHLVETTIHNYTQFIKELHEHSKKPAGELAREDFREFMRYLQHDRKLSSATLSHYFNAFRTFYNWLYDKTEDTKILNIGFFLTKNIKIKRRSKITQPPTVEEVERLRQVFYAYKTAWSYSARTELYNSVLRDHAMIELLISTGARSAEIRALTMEDIDLKNQVILIRHGKGDKERMALFDERTVKALTVYFENNIFGPSDKVFPIRQGNHLNMIIKRWAKRAGLNADKIHAHCFRHYFITSAQARSVSDQLIADQVGHASVSTLRHYSHLNLDVRREKFAQAGLLGPVQNS